MNMVPLLLVLASALLTACGDTAPVLDSVALNQRVAGAWMKTDGELFDDFNGPADYLQLREDGSGTIHNYLSSLTLPFCQDVLYAVTSDSTFLLTRDEDANTYGYNVQGDTLTVSFGSTRSATYTRVEAVPEERDCQTFSEIEFIEGLGTPPDHFSNLVYDGTLLWFRADNDPQLTSFDPMTGQLGPMTMLPAAFGAVTSFDSGGYNSIQTAAGGGFWAHCACGGSAEAWLGDPTDNSELDAFDTTELPTGALSLGAMAWDGDFLWIYGRNNTTAENLLVKLDTSGEPDAVVETFDFDVEPEALTWDGENLWGIYRTILIMIDPTTARVATVYRLPVGQWRWTGVAAVGSQFYVVGDDYRGELSQALIARLTP